MFNRGSELLGYIRWAVEPKRSGIELWENDDNYRTAHDHIILANNSEVKCEKQPQRIGAFDIRLIPPSPSSSSKTSLESTTWKSERTSKGKAVDKAEIKSLINATLFFPRPKQTNSP